MVDASLRATILASLQRAQPRARHLAHLHHPRPDDGLPDLRQHRRPVPGHRRRSRGRSNGSSGSRSTRTPSCWSRRSRWPIGPSAGARTTCRSPRHRSGGSLKAAVSHRAARMSWMSAGTRSRRSSGSIPTGPRHASSTRSTRRSRPRGSARSFTGRSLPRSPDAGSPAPHVRGPRAPTIAARPTDPADRARRDRSRSRPFGPTPTRSGSDRGTSTPSARRR